MRKLKRRSDTEIIRLVVGFSVLFFIDFLRICIDTKFGKIRKRGLSILSQRVSILSHDGGKLRFTTEGTEETQWSQSDGKKFYRNSNSVGATGCQ